MTTHTTSFFFFHSSFRSNVVIMAGEGRESLYNNFFFRPKRIVCLYIWYRLSALMLKCWCSIYFFTFFFFSLISNKEILLLVPISLPFLFEKQCGEGRGKNIRLGFGVWVWSLFLILGTPWYYGNSRLVTRSITYCSKKAW